MTVSVHSLARSPFGRLGLPIVGGACVAVCAVLMLSTLSPLWMTLVLCAGLVLLPPLIVRDPMAYWLYLLLLVLPFDVSKMLANPERAIELLEAFGAPWGGPPQLTLHVTDLLLLPLLGVWLLGKIRRRERIWFPRISYLPVAFLAFTTVTMFVAPFPYFSFLQLTRQLRYFVVYVFAADALDVRKVGKPILIIILGTLVMQGTLTVVRYRLQYVTPFFGDAFGRLSYMPEQESADSVTAESNAPERGLGTFYHANATAMHLEFLLPFALTLAFTTSSRRRRALYLLLFAIGIAGLYVTFSRAGMVAFLASVLMCVLVASWRGWVPRRLLAPVAGVVVFVGLCLLPLLTTYIQTRPTYSEYHFEHLRQGVIIALAHPIFGVGLNNSGVVRPYLVSERLMYGENLLPIHSQYLIGLSETGIIGFGLYVGFFVLVGIEAMRRTQAGDFYQRTFALGVLGAYTAMSVHMVSDILGSVPFHIMMWLYAGLIVAQRRRDPVAAEASLRALGRRIDPPLVTEVVARS